MGKEDAVHRPYGILLSHKEDELFPFAITNKKWVDLEIITLSEVNQTMTNVICHLCAEYNKQYK